MLRIAWSPIYAHPLPEGHRFPMAKYNLIPEQLIYEGTISKENLFAPQALTEEEILLTHDPVYWQRLRDLQLTPREMRKTGFPHSQQLVEREIVIGRGTYDCAKFAQQHGVSLNISGGTHHAFTDRGEGFCLLNDIAMAANLMLHRGEAEKILIIDLDVHQGNGTAEIFQEKPEVFTFSMHCAANYPLEKEKSDLDVALPVGTGDHEYHLALDAHLAQLFDKVKPDFVFYLSGVDVLATDKLGRLSLSKAGCKARDRKVFEAVQAAGLPVAVSMGGGYSAALRDIVEAHCNTYRLAAELWF